MPLQGMQRSEGGVLNPVVPHSRHGCWICCIIPGPSGRSIVCTRGGGGGVQESATVAQYAADDIKPTFHEIIQRPIMHDDGGAIF